MKEQFFGFSVLALAIAVLTGSPAQADVTAKDLQVIACALGFIEQPPSGEGTRNIYQDSLQQTSGRNIERIILGGVTMNF